MSDWFGRQPVKVVGGAGTTKDPRIVWLTHPPSELSRRLGNENVARSLGDYGYTHVWLRGCDHKTKTTKRAKMGTTTHRTATPPHAPCPVFSGFFGRRQASIDPLGCSTTSNEASQQAAASLTIHER
ncbi:hypothetical protein CDV31_015484 [Fusarium ambrosium]|uniref:Uncharacterized protein n=1 Tax=Fusarium ambrosium TaxID=131363 RepID=A0A428SNG4_9HYPO|nr:hypothetical protein CDV31_015484 [Fusarium ambrosium]